MKIGISTGIYSSAFLPSEAASLLLDTYPASAAYSLRKLSSSYGGFAIRVRRDSDNAEQDIGFDGNELDTVALNDFVNNYNSTLPLDTATALRAYSLRSLSTSYAGPTVRVRRDSDDTEQDFNESEIIDGTLQSFVNNYNSTLPLDTATATAGYSLRYLSSSYSGAVVRVRRDGDNAEQDITPDEIAGSSFGSLTALCGANALAYSQDYNQGAWGKVAAGTGVAPVVTTNFGQAPDSSFTADRIVFNRGAGTGVGDQSVLQQSGLALPLNWSIYLKSNTGSSFTLRMRHQAGAETLVTVSGDWTRYELPASTGTGGSICQLIAAGDVSESGDIDVLAWGAQATSGVELELYTKTEATPLTAVSNGYVTTWYDQTGNGNNAVQATAARQSKLYDSTSGVVTLNGEPALYFDGDDDYNAGRIQELENSDYFACCLYDMSTSQVDIEFVFTKNTGGNLGLELRRNGASATDAFVITGTDGRVIANGAVGRNIWSMGLSGTTRTGHLNGVLDYSLSASSQVSATDDVVIGSRSGAIPMIGYIQELIFYASDQSANREAIEGNINQHYNVYNNNGLVRTLYDQTANNQHATQTVLAAQPKIWDSATGLVTVNGRPSIKFDAIATNLIMPTITLSGEFHNFIAVSRESVDASIRTFVTGPATSQRYSVNGATGASRKLIVRVLSSGDSSITWDDADVGQTEIFTVNRDSSNVVRSSFSTPILSTIYSGTPQIGDHVLEYIGSTTANSLYWGGDLQELLFYDSDQSTNRTAIEGNINQYYNIYSANGYVATWYDQSGNGYDATESTAANQPKIYDVTSGLVAKSGKPAIQFRLNVNTSLTADRIAYPGEFSHFVLADKDSTVSNFQMYLGDSSSSIKMGVDSLTPNRSIFTRVISASTGGLSWSDLDTASRIVNITRDSSNIVTQAFNADVPTTLYSGAAQVGDHYANRIGNSNSGQSWDGLIQEVLTYSSDQTANRADINANINSHYGIY